VRYSGLGGSDGDCDGWLRARSKQDQGCLTLGPNRAIFAAVRKRVRLSIVLLITLVCVIAWQVLRLRQPVGQSERASAVAMTFVGYTNPPVGHTRFALFSLSNQAPYAVRWRGSWTELEGNPNHMARVTNRSLPCSYEPVLKAGASLTLAVGEPVDASETRRWRFAMLFSRYRWRERWLDFSFRHKLPLRLGKIMLVDAQRVLSPTNCVTVTTAWFGK